MPIDPTTPRPEPGPDADTQATIAEKATHAKEAVVEKAHVAQSTARDIVTDHSGSVKSSVPLTAAVAVGGVVLIGVLAWRRRRR